MRSLLAVLVLAVCPLLAQSQDCPGGCCGPYGCGDYPRLAYVPYLAYYPVAPAPYAYRPYYRDRGGIDLNFNFRGGFSWPYAYWGDRDRDRGRERDRFSYRGSWR